MNHYFADYPFCHSPNFSSCSKRANTMKKKTLTELTYRKGTLRLWFHCIPYCLLLTRTFQVAVLHNNICNKAIKLPATRQYVLRTSSQRTNVQYPSWNDQSKGHSKTSWRIQNISIQMQWMQVYSLTTTKILYDIFEPPGTPKNWVK